VKFTFADMGRWAGMPEAVRTGAPLATDTADVTENPFWERLVPAIAVLSVPSALTAADKLNVANAGPISILDVGGGSGIYSIIWLGMNPEARSIQVDWKNVNQIALAAADAQRVGERFHTLDGDFHTADFGTNEHDVAIYSHIAHQETPAANTAVFRKLRNALKPGGTLVINDFVVTDDRAGPPFPLIFHSMMLLQSKHGATWREATTATGSTRPDSPMSRSYPHHRQRPSSSRDKRRTQRACCRARLRIRGYISTVRYHGDDVLTALRDAIPGNPWSPPRAAIT
jgi:SAM-dependent methyltransferase